VHNRPINIGQSVDVYYICNWIEEKKMKKNDDLTDMMQVRMAEEMVEYCKTKGKLLGGGPAWIRSIVHQTMEKDGATGAPKDTEPMVCATGMGEYHPPPPQNCTGNQDTKAVAVRAVPRRSPHRNGKGGAK
jgi:hypothetical protein